MIDPAGTATCLLNAFKASFTELGGDVPERAYTMVGQVPFDCEQLVVTLTSIFPGRPGQPSAQVQSAFIPNATAFIGSFAFVLVRGWPTDGRIGLSRLQTAGTKALADAALMTQALVKIMSDEPSPCAGCQMQMSAGVTTVGPTGGTVGLIAAIDVMLG